MIEKISNFLTDHFLLVFFHEITFPWMHNLSFEYSHFFSWKQPVKSRYHNEGTIFPWINDFFREITIFTSVTLRYFCQIVIFFRKITEFPCEIKLYSWEQNISSWNHIISVKSLIFHEITWLTLNRNLFSWNISMKLRYFREVMIFFREIKLYSWEHNIFSWNHISLTKSHNLRWITMFFVKSHDSHHFREITYYLLRNHTICVVSQCLHEITTFLCEITTFLREITRFLTSITPYFSVWMEIMALLSK